MTSLTRKCGSVKSVEEDGSLCPQHLYVQGNSELLLILMLQNGRCSNIDTVNSLVSSFSAHHILIAKKSFGVHSGQPSYTFQWRCILPQLGELDILVKQCSHQTADQVSGF